MFRPRGEHPIWFIRTLRNQVINQNPRVPLRPRNRERSRPTNLARRTESRNQTLAPGLLIPRGSVNLTRQKQTFYFFHFQAMIQLPWIDRIVLNRIPRANHLRVFQPGHRRDHRRLHIHRHTRRHPVHVHLVRIQPLGLEENLVTRFVRELHNLVFDRRTISRTNTLNIPAIQWGPPDVLPQHPVCFLRSKCYIALNLLPVDLPRHKRKRSRYRVPWLRLEPRPVQRTSIQPRRRTRLQPCPVQIQLPQLVSQQIRRSLPITPTVVLALPHMSQSVQKRPSRNHHRATGNLPPIPQQHAPNPTTPSRNCGRIDNQLRHFRLQNPQIRLPLQNLAHPNPILLLVALRPWRPHRRSATGIQQSKLNPNGVSHLSHHPTERINLANQMTLRNPADRRIARHLRDEVDIHRDHRRLQSQPRTRPRRLTAGMTGANYDNIILQSQNRACSILTGGDLFVESTSHRIRRP